MFPSRRQIMLALASLPAVAGCSGIQITPTQLQQDVKLISDGLPTILPVIEKMTTVPPNVVANVQTELLVIQQNAAQVASALTPSASTVQTIANAVGLIGTLLTPFFPAAPVVAGVVQAAIALLPTILAAVGVTPPKAIRPAMSPDQARLVLAAGAK